MEPIKQAARVDREVGKKAVKEILSAYPAKVAKNRSTHIVVKGKNKGQKIAANTRTIPGIITNRGCCYAGCKGVVIGPIKDMVHITHGPIGCGYYSWATRRNQGMTANKKQMFLPYSFSTDMQDSDIVFGGEKKLELAVKEAYELFKPKAISISATCPVGLIGDDVQAVAGRMQKELGITVIAMNCEGYKGVSQSAGHHIANNKLFQEVIGTEDREYKNPFTINLLGEYNIGGDGWEIKRILEELGYEVVSFLTGDAGVDDIRRAHNAKLNLVQCHRSINYMAEMMKKKYGIPWLKVNFIGVNNTSRTLRDVAKFFGAQELIKRTEEVIERERKEIEPVIDTFRKGIKGRTVMLFVGGSRSHHYQDIFYELGVETVMSGYEFAHRDDYEGRRVLPEIKPDADSKNIEELNVQPDPEKYRPVDGEKIAGLQQKGVPVNDYAGLYPSLPEGALMIDDLNHYETEKLIERLKPDLFCSGIKDKYVVQKMGIPSKQLHSYDYSGPYAGFRGAVIFARDIYQAFNSPSWRYIKPPWETEPEIVATLTEKEKRGGKNAGGNPKRDNPQKSSPD
ncbi:MAG: nitrogenase molybdenum-iron protein alpha chain [Nitrospirae bacterium]|nr:nitrogenase molybdenum-iron protein alpha chain [Nitrospirota bacterium]